MEKFLNWVKRKDKIISLIVETMVSVVIWIVIGLLGQCGFNLKLFILTCFLVLFVCYFPTIMTYFDSNATDRRIEKLEKRIELLEKKNNNQIDD